MTKNLCIIPARGGSKRIPKKNIKEFLGKPIIAYSIEAALKSNLFDEVMVSTEDLEIAKTAEEYGAKIPFFRSGKTADDFASTVDVLLEVIEEYSKRYKDFSYICCFYPTAPFITAIKLREAFFRMGEEKLDVIFPVLPFSYPIQRALRIVNNKIRFFEPKFEKSRSQDMERSYHDAGQFYFMKTKELIEKRTIFSDNAGFVEFSELEAHDIDNEMDWKMAELKYQLLNG